MPVVAALFLIVVLLGWFPAIAQLPFSGGNGEGEGPIEILAEGGIEWQQERSLVRAQGNARAIRGDIEVRADVLTAHYRTAADDSNEIWRLEADGNVVITTPTETAYADQGLYDVDSAVLVLRRGATANADRVRLVGENSEISADEQMEYWEARQMVVARGNALATQPEKQLQADVLVAYLEDKGQEGMQVQRVEAFDNVRIITQREDVRADRGVYRVSEETASLTGTVKITRGPNQLNGCRADVDLEKGLSTLYGCTGSDGRTSQVRGLIQPEQDDSSAARPGGNEN